MDPLTGIGAAASVVQLVETVGKTIQYLSTIKDEKIERIRLSREFSSLYNILLDLEARLDEGNLDDQWIKGLRSLAMPHGPIDQLEEALGKVLKKLEPKSGFQKTKGTLLWPFDRKQLEEILGQIERQKSTINYALQGDQTNLQKAIKADTGQIPDLVDGFQSIKLGMHSIQNRHQGISPFPSPFSVVRSPTPTLSTPVVRRWSKITVALAMNTTPLPDVMGSVFPSKQHSSSRFLTKRAQCVSSSDNVLLKHRFGFLSKSATQLSYPVYNITSITYIR